MTQKPGYLSYWLSKQRIKKISSYLEGEILDIGCGDGLVANLAKNNNLNYVGIDFDDDKIIKLKKKYDHFSFYKLDMDVSEININKKFDTIVMLAFVEHIFNQKFLFQNLLKILKKNGKIIITTPTPFGNDFVHRIGAFFGLFSKGGGQDDHIVIYNKRRFKILAKEIGLKIITYHKFQFFCNQFVILNKK